MSSLQSRLDEFKKTFESGAPPYKRAALGNRKDASSDSRAQGVGN